MLYEILTSLIEQYSFLNVFKYLTFRTGLSVVTSLIVVFIIGGPLIKMFSENMKLACWEDLGSRFQKVEKHEIPLASDPKFREKHVLLCSWWTRRMKLVSVGRFFVGSDFNRHIF